MRRISINLRDCIAKVSGVVVAAHLLSADPALATIAGAGIEGAINGTHLDKRDPEPAAKLAKAIRQATKSAIADAGFEMPFECQEAIVQDLFSIKNAVRYLQTEIPEQMLRQSMVEIIGRFPACEIETLPLDDMVNCITYEVREAVLRDDVLLALDTNVSVHLHTDLLQKFLARLELMGKGNQAQTISLPRWLARSNKSVSPHYVERPELDMILQTIAEHGKVWLYGMGGIGKTELLRRIRKACEPSYGHMAWIQYTGNFRENLIDQMIEINTKDMQQEEAFARIERTLTAMGTDLLLMVDNVDQKPEGDPDLQLLQRLPCTVLITARGSQRLSSFTGFPVDFLDAERCKELFFRHAELAAPYDEAALNKIIARTGRHTLATEIIAKAAKKRNKSLPQVLGEMEAQGLDIPTAVRTAHSDDREEKMMQQLDKLYTLSSLGSDSLFISILKNFAVLPYLPLAVEDTVRFLGLDPEREQALYELADLGWLELSDAGLAMHGIVREIVKRWGVEFAECEKLIHGLNEATSPEDYFGQMRYYPYVSSVAEAFPGVSGNPAVAKLYNNLSLIYRAKGKLREALKWQLRSKEIREALFPDGGHSDLATTYNNLSLIHQDMGNLPEALKGQLWAKQIMEALFPDITHSDLATIYNNLSLIYQDMGNLPEALKWQLQGKKIREELFSDGVHPDLAMTYNNLSTIYRALGNLPEALEWQLRAKEIMEMLFPDGIHPYISANYNNLSSIYKAMGNLPEALEWQLRAKEIMETLFPDGVHPDLATTYSKLSSIYKALGNMREALKWQLRTKEIREALFPDGIHPSLATTYNYLSTFYQDMGNMRDALKWQLRAKAVKEALFSDGVHPDLATTYNNLSTTYYATGNLPEALKWQLRAKEIIEALYPDGVHPSLATTYRNLSSIYRAMGNHSKAYHWRKEAKRIMAAHRDRGQV